MIYVMSDLHGEFDKFKAMLEKISFSADDELYILGDIIDRGPNSVEILKYIMPMPNVYPILGNHEVMAYNVLKKLLTDITEANFSTQIDSNAMLDIIEWQQNGGATTMKQFSSLSKAERMELLEYFEEFLKYEAVDTDDKTFILVHAGLGNFQKGKKLSQYSLAELVETRPDCEKQLFEDESIFVVFGHTPTKAINGKWEIYRSHNNICIDCGAHYGGRLACLCLDTDEEFYID